ncbi:MAG: radical SAM protein [Nanoarchaeota archaeon]|nr:radical SAM protein [Nanoarchaeota archaeon]
MAKKINVVLIRSPQPYLITEEGGLFSPNRLLTPEPTLPLIHGILQDAGEKIGLELKVTQLDLRDSRNGEIIHEHYGNVKLDYIEDPLRKMCSGVSIDSQMDLIEKADVVGFTNNFTMVRNVVLRNIQKVRNIFPDKEIWVGGRDVFPESITELYAEAGDKRNLVIFNGHVFSSLPEYVKAKAGNSANLHGITIFNVDGKKRQYGSIPLTKITNDSGLSVPLPIFPDPDVLGKFTDSGEGPIEGGNGRFAHMTTAIGCPHKCGYCTTGWRERYLVSRGIDSIVEELNLYQSLGVKTLAIMDDNLLSIGPDKVNKVMNLINSYGFNIEYGNGLELGLLHRNWDEVQESVLRNCTMLYAPLEDLTQNVSYRKLEPISEQLKLIGLIADFFDRKAEKRARYVTMGVIVGVPGHTHKGLYETLPKNAQRFLELFVGKNVGTAITAFNYMPLAGTSFGDKAIRSRRIVTDIVRAHPEVVNFELATYAPEGLTHNNVFDAYKKVINLNPAGRVCPKGELLGSRYEDLKRFGERALPYNQRSKLPSYWRELGKEFTGGRVAGSGLHYKARMTQKIAEENRTNL